MRLSQLEALIDEARAEVGDEADPKVKIAAQQHYPLAHSVYGIYVDDGVREVPSYMEDDPDYEPDEHEPAIWIVEGSQDRDNPYGVPRDAWDGAMQR